MTDNPNPASNPEAEEAEKLRLKIEAHKRSTFDYLAHLMRMDSDELAKCGYRSGWAQASLSVMTRARDEIEGWIRAHERKYRA